MPDWSNIRWNNQYPNSKTNEIIQRRSLNHSALKTITNRSHIQKNEEEWYELHNFNKIQKYH